MACLYISSFSTPSRVENTKSPRSVEFTLWREVVRICSGFKVVLT